MSVGFTTIKHRSRQEEQSGCSLLHYAIAQGDAPKALQIIQQTGAVLIERNGKSNIVQAIQTCPDLELISELVDRASIAILNHRDPTADTTPLIAAARSSNVAALQLLLAKKADPNIGDMLESTPLSFVASYGENLTPKEYQKTSQTTLLMAKILIKNGALPDSMNCHGETPLKECFSTFHTPRSELISYLIQKGASPAMVKNALRYKSAEYSQQIIEAIKNGYAKRKAQALLLQYFPPDLVEIACDYV